MFTEHTMVILNKDKPDLGLFAGDVGTIIHVYNDAYEVEFINRNHVSTVLTDVEIRNVQ